EAILRAGGRVVFEPRMKVVHHFEGWAFERDVRRNLGYAAIESRRREPRIAFAWVARLGYAAIPFMAVARTIYDWRVCLRAEPRFSPRLPPGARRTAGPRDLELSVSVAHAGGSGRARGHPDRLRRAERRGPSFPRPGSPAASAGGSSSGSAPVLPGAGDPRRDRRGPGTAGTLLRPPQHAPAQRRRRDALPSRPARPRARRALRSPGPPRGALLRLARLRPQPGRAGLSHPRGVADRPRPGADRFSPRRRPASPGVGER